MQLDHLAVQLRLRNPWEAMDLGFGMVRAWLRRVYTPWLAVFVPVCAASLLLPPIWAWLLVWWLKPAFDRVVLHVLANGVFGNLPSPSATLRALPQMMRPGLLAALTIYRFDFARSFNLPIWQLERQRGRAARQRARQLHRRTRSYAVWLTVACLHFETVIVLSSVALYDLLVPASAQEKFDFLALLSLDAEQMWLQHALTAAYFIAVTVIEPFYVAAGFALYLNRRTALEGWDIEVELRQLGERARSKRHDAVAAVSAGVAAIAFAGALLVASIEPVQAQATATGSATGSQRDAQAEQAVKKVLARPEFQTWQERTVVQYIGEKKGPSRRIDMSSLQAIVGTLAELARVLAWIALGLGIAWLVYLVGRRLEWWTARRPPEYVPPETLFGLDVRPESMPADPGRAALALAREGELLRALSLLYRAALVTLMHRDGIELASGDTEADCLRKSRPRISDTAAGYFLRLLGAWQRLAYARRTLAPHEVDELCLEWSEHFGAAGAPRSSAPT